MAELGETQDPRVLVPGLPAAIQRAADKLRGYGRVLVEAGEGLRRIDDGGWTGQAADAFHDFFDGTPAEWLRTGDLFGDAAKLVEQHREVLEWAQRQAAEAIAVWNEAQALSDAHQRDSEQNPDGAPPRTFVDPGEEKRDHARWLLHSTRQQLDIEGTRTGEAITRATDALPGGRSFWGQTWHDLQSAGSGAWNELASFGETAWKIDPARLIAEPEQVWEDVRSIPATTQQAWTRLGTDGVLDLQDWRENPARALGESAVRFGKLSGPQGLVFGPAQLIHHIRKAAQEQPRHHVIISEERYPQSAAHAEDAQNGMTYRGTDPIDGVTKQHPQDVTIDRDDAQARRRKAVNVVPAIPRDEGVDRDEYPPAVFAEGGAGSSVQYINASDNRGAGSSMGHQLRGLDNGETVTINVR